ncbi:MAG: Ig-like domain-containing protein, partial [Treponema sp.]|nr:Ig-like domain-containing protein [Treponema sp.]
MKKPVFSLFSALILSSLCFSACDLLRLSPFEVLSWNPGEGFMEEPGNIEVSVLLSHDPDRLSVERYFSLSEDGTNLEGDFLWEGERVYFIPRAPLERNHEYVISITAEAKDRNGLSMDRSFEGSFSTRPPVSRPKLLSVFP